MSTNAHNEFKQYIKDYITDALNERSGQTVYACDLSNALYEGDNMDGWVSSFKMNLNDLTDEYRATIEYWKFNAGDEYANKIALAFFDDCQSQAECYLVFCFVDAVINGFLCKNEYNGRDIWNEQIEINDEFIKWIVDNLDNATDNGFNDLMGY